VVIPPLVVETPPVLVPAAVVDADPTAVPLPPLALEACALPPELDEVPAGPVWQAAQTVSPTTLRSLSEPDLFSILQSRFIGHAPLQATPALAGHSDKSWHLRVGLASPQRARSGRTVNDPG
jgi:hypothetical protein